MGKLSDAELIQRAKDKNGNPGSSAEAVGELYDRYQPSVFRYIWARVSNPHQAEDLTGEVFTRMVAHLPAYRTTAAPFLAWLYRMSRNLVIDHHRKAATHSQLPIEQVEILPSSEPGPAQTVENQMFIEQVQAALYQLKPFKREIIILRFIVGLPIKEVAAILGKTTGSIKINQHRALRELRKILEPQTGVQK